MDLTAFGRRSLLVGGVAGLASLINSGTAVAATRSSTKSYGSMTVAASVDYTTIYSSSGAKIGVKVTRSAISYSGASVGEITCFGSTVHRGIDEAGLIRVQPGRSFSDLAFSGSVNTAIHCVRSWSRSSSTGWSIRTATIAGVSYSYRDTAVAAKIINWTVSSCSIPPVPKVEVAYQFDRGRWLARDFYSTGGGNVWQLI